MRKVILTTPISNEDIEPLRIGDIIFLSGCLVTGRDDVHHRLLKQHHPLPVDISGKALFHASHNERDRMRQRKVRGCFYRPTTSMRMEKYEKEFIGKTGLKLIVGKGGMGPDTAEGCRMYKGNSCGIPGMRRSCGKTCVEVEGVEWLDLAYARQNVVLRVREFGPLIVSIDTMGNNLFENNKKKFGARKDAAVEEICRHVDYFG